MVNTVIVLSLLSLTMSDDINHGGSLPCTMDKHLPNTVNTVIVLLSLTMSDDINHGGSLPCTMDKHLPNTVNTVIVLLSLTMSDDINHGGSLPCTMDKHLPNTVNTVIVLLSLTMSDDINHGGSLPLGLIRMPFAAWTGIVQQSGSGTILDTGGYNSESESIVQTYLLHNCIKSEQSNGTSIHKQTSIEGVAHYKYSLPVQQH